MLRPLVDRPLAARRAVLTHFHDAAGNAIDQGLALYFPQPHSYTGEDVVELHAHGGPVVLQLLLRRCLELGARIAEPGEFTKRAFLNDKLDLAQAESVADLIDASTAAAARSAVRSLQGEFSRRIEALVQDLTELRMLVEAGLDFPEEQTPTLMHTESSVRLLRLREQLGQVLGASRQGSLLRNGIHVVIAGQPNVGKSSLLNRLAGDDIAIVSELPGTTRDTIRQSLDIAGVPLHIADTAGLRDSSDTVENIGITKTWDNISRADLVLWVSDLTRSDTEPSDAGLLKRIPTGTPVIHVGNKVDLVPCWESPPVSPMVAISAKTGAGIERLQQEILKVAGWEGHDQGVILARERHVQALLAAAEHLDGAGYLADAPELFAEELRLCQRALGEITGEVTADDLLGRIFARFCIGK